LRFITGIVLALALPLFATAEPIAGVQSAQAAPPQWHLCLNPWVIDGDSIRCSNVGEIRLLGIDAPDYRDSPPCAGHFGDHVCDDAAAKAAKRALIRLKQRMRQAQWTVLPVTRDHHGRMVAEVRAGSIELSCFQLSNGSARYIPQYDNGGRVARACGR